MQLLIMAVHASMKACGVLLATQMLDVWFAFWFCSGLQNLPKYYQCLAVYACEPPTTATRQQKPVDHELPIK